MLTSLGFILLGGAALAGLCRRIQLPTIIGLMLAGLLLGPQGYNCLDSTMLTISPDLRQMALLIILVKAGLAINLRDIWNLGRPLLMMSTVPVLLELVVLTYLGLTIFNLHGLEAVLLATAVCAVSPAVVVFRMIHLIEEKYGIAKKIPQLIMVASSLEDIVVVVVFSLVLTLVEAHVEAPEGLGALEAFGQVPVALVGGIILGLVSGFIVAYIAKYMSHSAPTISKAKILKLSRLLLHKDVQNIVNDKEKAKVKAKETRTVKEFLVTPQQATLLLTVIVAVSFVLVAISNWLKPLVSVSGLLAIMIMASVVKGQVSYELGQMLNRMVNQLWIPIEIILFVLVGAAIDTTYMLSMSGMLIAVIALGLVGRTMGVVISLWKTPLNRKERAYCAISYAPKATVQAAIGGIPLALGLSSGPLVLAASAMAIVITSPIGAICMDYFYKRWLTYDGQER
ncbi:cation:proton antiporter [Veillonella criceti]|uniref:Potassium/proton antiporter n=1 Tax=Veillonella criceti TaxID=103891 RepID=A0A380NJ66_9FIRM|nr:cation:proton antiporter [Veillonella criceti]SUP41645.1 potassium/proton antiporter [Veillonella criceti]